MAGVGGIGGLTWGTGLAGLLVLELSEYLSLLISVFINFASNDCGETGSWRLLDSEPVLLWSTFPFSSPEPVDNFRFDSSMEWYGKYQYLQHT